MDFMMLLMRTAILFEPMRIFLPLALFSGLLGVLKLLFDVISFGPRTGSFGPSIFFQPVISTSAILLLLASLQLLLIGMVADGLFKRMARHDTPLVPSHAVRFYEPADAAGAQRGVAEPSASAPSEGQWPL